LRQQTIDGEKREVTHLIKTEFSTTALICNRRVEVAIGHNDLASLERGANYGGHVVRAICGKQQGFGAWRNLTLAVQKQFANLAAEVGAARL
jgi:hypothetical protein